MSVELNNTVEEKIKMLDQLRLSIEADGAYWESVARKAESANPWFTQQNIQSALSAICNEFLQSDKLKSWLSGYRLPATKQNVGIVMAGNIPLVGFADWLAVFMSGHRAILKTSDKDTVLFTAVIDFLVNNFNPEIVNTVIVDKLSAYDAVIATGSDNSAMYFEQYFGGVPHLIRRNRTAIAVIHGSESEAQLLALWDDISAYFGLGCRNVTYLLLPEGYDPALLAAVWEKAPLIQHHKYRNNYDYDLAISMLNKDKFYYNDNILLIEQDSLHSRIASVNYQFYSDYKFYSELIAQRQDKIQCVISAAPLENIPVVLPGHSQQPALTDYADNVDTMNFLCSL